MPAALCGVAALRPTVGRTSTAHCPPNAFSIMAFGVIAGCLADALLVYAAIANAGMLAPTPVINTYTKFCKRHASSRFSLAALCCR